MTRIQGALVTVCLLGIQIVSASTRAEAEVMVGIKAGPSFASQSTDHLAPTVTWSTRTGLAVGADLELTLAQWLWLRIEPMYVQKGSEFDWTSEVFSGGVQKYDYFTIPLNLKAVLCLGDLRPFVFVGPTVGFTLSSEAQFDQDSIHMELESRDMELSLDFGAGVDILLTRVVGLTLDARYSLGLTDVDSHAVEPKTNRAVLVLAGLLVSL